MRPLALGLLLVLLLVTPAHAGFWLTGAVTNPATNQVIVTTGALSAQTAQFVVFLRSTVAVTVAVERLTSGAATVATDSVQFVLAAGASPFMIPLGMVFADGDTFRVRVVTGVTGTVQAAIRFNDGETPGYCLQGLGCAH